MLFKQSKCIGCNTCGLYPDQLPPKRGRSAGAQEYESVDNGLVFAKAENCPARALEQCGREWTLEELMAEVEKERDVMEDSGGGVTLCGGEPLMQPQATLAVLKELGLRGFHRTVDTSLYASPETVRAIAQETDLFLVDLKHMDAELHRRLTGVSNEQILENVKMLGVMKAPVWFRIPLIEGVNADEENIEATARFISTFPSSTSHGGSHRVHLLPYHDVGKDKHHRRGTPFNPDNLSMAVPSDATIEHCKQQFERHGISVVVGG